MMPSTQTIASQQLLHQAAPIEVLGSNGNQQTSTVTQRSAATATNNRQPLRSTKMRHIQNCAQRKSYEKNINHHQQQHALTVEECDLGSGATVNIAQAFDYSSHCNKRTCSARAREFWAFGMGAIAPAACASSSPRVANTFATAILMAQVYHRASSTAQSLIASPTKRRIIIHDTSESEQETIEGSKSTTTNAASHVIKTNGNEEDQRQTGQSEGESHKNHSTLLCLHHHRWQAIALSKIHQLHHYVTMIMT